MENSSAKDGTTYDFLTCITIWIEFNVKNMVGYHDHYLKRDKLLLADVFEKSINACL